MAFNNFTFPEVLSDLELTLAETDLFPAVTPFSLNPVFAERLRDSAALARSVSTEKARSEFIIAPVLLELRFLLGNRFGLFSGVELKAEPKAGLTGICDFLLTREPLQTVVKTPIVAIVEAKNDSLRSGLGQCIASMVGAQMLNGNEGETGRVYGCVTTGSVWQFLHLEHSTVTIDTQEYFLDRVDLILAIFKQIIEGDTTH
ncbi:MAG: hypothetical protein OHK0029_11820 [Armatimonadaceae bacterium]